MRYALVGGAMVVLAMAGLGCGGKAKSSNLQAQAFCNPTPTTAPALAVPVERRNPAPPEPPAGDRLAGSADAAPKEVDIALPPVENLPTTTRPAGEGRRGASGGTYMIVGVVVAQANGKAIYADRILSKIDAALYAKAVDKAQPYTPQEYRAYASSLIRKEVDAEIFDELEFAAAQHNNTDEERQMAEGITYIWRGKEITRAGGSLAIARQKSLQEDNMDFDERVVRQFRQHMVVIYYEKHVWPREQVSAEDMRRYYDRKLNDLFTDKSAVLFRVIKVGIGDLGGRERAQLVAKDIAEKARRGDDFRELARTRNSDSTWMRNGGYMDMEEKAVPVNAEAREGDPEYGKMVVRKEGKWYPKGSLALTELEDALLAAEKGAIVGPMEIGQAYYVAKLEDKKLGRVRPFEDEKVQQDIRRDLTREQRTELRRKELLKLMTASVSWIDRDSMETAVEMAMQKYWTWKREAQAK